MLLLTPSDSFGMINSSTCCQYALRRSRWTSCFSFWNLRSLSSRPVLLLRLNALSRRLIFRCSCFFTHGHDSLVLDFLNGTYLSTPSWIFDLNRSHMSSTLAESPRLCSLNSKPDANCLNPSQSALCSSWILLGHCFFLIGLASNSVHTTLWSLIPGRICVLFTWFGLFVIIRSRVLPSLVGSQKMVAMRKRNKNFN